MPKETSSTKKPDSLLNGIGPSVRGIPCVITMGCRGKGLREKSYVLFALKVDALGSLLPRRWTRVGKRVRARQQQLCEGHPGGAVDRASLENI